MRFEVEAPARIEVAECNCSICAKVGLSAFDRGGGPLPPAHGARELTTYTFNTGVAQHYFCKHCGVKSFYIPRSHPDGVSVNARCLDGGTIESMSVLPFDGRNWDAARAAWRDT